MKISNDVAFQDAALIEPLSVVVHALKRLGLLDNYKKDFSSDLVVIGAGFLGDFSSSNFEIKI